VEERNKNLSNIIARVRRVTGPHKKRSGQGHNSLGGGLQGKALDMNQGAGGDWKGVLVDRKKLPVKMRTLVTTIRCGKRGEFQSLKGSQ